MANNQNLIPAKKGEVRNPKGRGKGVQNTKTRLTKLLEVSDNTINPLSKEVELLSIAEQLDIAQIKKALCGDTRAYIAILERLEGKPQLMMKTDRTNWVEEILKLEDWGHE